MLYLRVLLLLLRGSFFSVKMEFDYTNLFSELQVLVRSSCTPSARSMLGMTCRAERASAVEKDRTHLLLYLAFEGDPYGFLLDQLGSIGEQGTIKRARRLNRKAEEKKREWRDHELTEECVRGGHLDLLKGIHKAYAGYDLPWNPTACPQCIQLAVATANHSLILYVMQCYDAEDNGPIPMAAGSIATVEAIRFNDMDLLCFLKEQKYLDGDVDFAWDQPMRQDGPNVCLVDCGDAIHWFLTDHHISNDCLFYLFRCVLQSMIYHQWDMVRIEDFIKNHMHVKLRPFWQPGQYRQNHCVFLLAHSLALDNAEIARYAMEQCWIYRFYIGLSHLENVIVMHTKHNSVAREKALTFFGLLSVLK